MPWTQPNRWVLSLLLLTAFSLGMASHVVVAHNYTVGPLSDPEQSVVKGWMIFAAVVGGFARMEIVTRRKAHDLANGQSSIANVVDKRLNGDLDKRITGIVAAQMPAAINAALDDRMDDLARKIAEHMSNQSRPKVQT